MKQILLQQLSHLLDSKDEVEIAVLRTELISLITSARLNLDKENGEQAKKLIIATINNYADTADAGLKQALTEHYKTLEQLLE